MNIIEAKDLKYSYPDGTPALDGASFCAGENEIVSIIGPNGAGKTTFLLALCGLIEVQGVVKIFGECLTRENIKELRSHVGFVFQNPDDQLFMPTVYQDVAFGPRNLGFPKNEIPEIVKEVLVSVGLQGFEDRVSHHLSIGERKRVSLATAMAMRPRLFLFDEPTSNLDPRSRREFIELVQKIEPTRIIASHDIGMIGQLSKKVVILNRGRVITEGPADEILGNKQLMEENGLL